jgi:hypothetical protein
VVEEEERKALETANRPVDNLMAQNTHYKVREADHGWMD